MKYLKMLSKAEMKKIKGRGGVNCLQEFAPACSLNHTGNPDQWCCPGLTCELNATESGTICIRR